MSGAQALSLFETMVVVDDLPGAQAVNAALKAAILAQRARSPGVAISNIGGWQSTHDLQNWGGEAAAALLKHLVGLADSHSVDIRSPGAPRHRWVPEIWANVSPPSASNQIHTHPGAYWSAVYYVDDGADAGGAEAGGDLVLVDPRMPMTMMTMPNLRLRKPGGAPYEPQIALRPKNGRIIMFPGWLNHGVMPYRGTRERISVAVNLMAVPLGA
jgi:uncharacterized protein (TIGR02466 family)